MVYDGDYHPDAEGVGDGNGAYDVRDDDFNLF